MTAERPRPTRPPSRWDDGTCGVKGCRCPHNAVWSPSNTQPCDHGQIPAGPGATTPGVRANGGGQITPGVATPELVRRCPTCKAHAERVRTARQESA
jgi:hypothetical protein